MTMFTGKVKAGIEAMEAIDALNEIMGVEGSREKNRRMTMRECLQAMMHHAGVNRAHVYQARKGRIGSRSCYVFSFLSNGRRYSGWVDSVTCEILRFGFQPA